MTAKETRGDQDQDEAMTDSAIDADADVHPVLGLLLMDLGYKCIHGMKASNLAACIWVWKKQRICRHTHAQKP